ncbi:MAG: flippase-like domain-containing protein [Nisaea sp.]|uniref:lysylphosphatidylglycerol synthase transmembrane domain-containing protein n=1 Tax=Nisaea sp. TaxID=2024842 RepID=UPI001B1804A4|nr:lysylphosphatidylglycerol synthase transmembrane domain-containing protein [Nisaea sp.]MBO6562575.1 flippase-like domain-containing protein [Nisaea sp.]
MNRSLGILLVKLAVSGGLLYWVLGSIDRAQLFEAVSELDPVLLCIAFVVLVMQYPLGALRWRELLRLIGLELETREVIRIHLVGVFLNQMLPSALGGDAYRVWSAGRGGKGWGRAVCSVLLDRVAALMILVLLLAAMLPHLATILPDGPVTDSLVMLVIAAMLVMPAGFALARPAARVLDRIRFLRKLAPIAMNANLLWSEGGASLRIAVFGLMTQLSTAACVWLVARAAGADIGFFTMLGLTLPVLLTLAVPISIAGWGVREGAMIFALGLVGIPAETGLLISLVWGGLSLTGGVMSGAAFLVQAPERKKLATYAAEAGALGERDAEL